MGSEKIDVNFSPDEAFSKIQQAIGTSDYKIRSIEASKSIIAEGNREFKWWIVIVLAIFIWPAAIVYYFTRHRSSVTAIVIPSESGCKITINSNGNSGKEVMQEIVKMLS